MRPVARLCKKKKTPGSFKRTPGSGFGGWLRMPPMARLLGGFVDFVARFGVLVPPFGLVLTTSFSASFGFLFVVVRLCARGVGRFGHYFSQRGEILEVQSRRRFRSALCYDGKRGGAFSTLYHCTDRPSTLKIAMNRYVERRPARFFS